MDDIMMRLHESLAGFTSNRRRALAWAALAPLLLVIAACDRGAQPAPVARPPVDVRAARATITASPDWYEAGGVVQARLSATLTSRVLAPVIAVRVHPGDQVRAGQLLIELDGRELDANARRAGAAVEAAEQAARSAQSEREAAGAAVVLSNANLHRISRLQERKSATPQELDEATASAHAAGAHAASAQAQIAQAEAAVVSARAASEAASVTASYARFTAPFDGRVSEKLIEPGNMAAPGVPLLRLDSADGFRVDVRLDESRAALVSPGQQMAVTIGNAGEGRSVRVTRGTVFEIARAIDADTRAFLVKIEIGTRTNEGEPLRSGMFARVRFAGQPRKGLRVPASAIVKRGQVATVFVIEKELARVRLVQTGTTDDGQTEILSGLDQGEVVVVSPPPAVVDRTAVRATHVDALAGGTPPPEEVSR